MSLRIRAPLPADDTRRGRGYVQEDPYMSRLVKLVPAEAVGLYPFLMQQANTLTPADGSPRYAVYFAAWVLLLVVIVLRWRATSDPGQGAQWGAILIAAVAFFIWVHVMGGDFGFERLLPQAFQPEGMGVTRGPLPDGATSTPASMNPEDIKKFVSNTALVTWTMLAPVVYRGDEPR
ncbi:MAG: hypothetical protein AB7O43_07925 [Hyphomicrobiaceae bacterium]